MRVDHVLAGRPGEDGEAAILRGDERDRVALVVDELRGRQVARAAELRRMDDAAAPPSIGSVTVRLLDRRRCPAAARSSRRTRADRSDRSRSWRRPRRSGRRARRRRARKRPASAVSRVRVGAAASDRRAGERRAHRIRDRRDDRLAPARRYPAARRAAGRRGCARASTPRAARARSPSRVQKPGESNPSSDFSSVGQSGRLAPSRRQILTWSPSSTATFANLPIAAAAMLDDEQSRGDDLEHKAERRQRRGRAPHRNSPPSTPDAQVDAGPFDSRRDRASARGSSDSGSANNSGRGLPRAPRTPARSRRVAFLAPQARPEAGVDDRFDSGGVLLRRDRARAMGARCLAMTREIGLDARQ